MDKFKYRLRIKINYIEKQTMKTDGRQITNFEK